MKPIIISERIVELEKKLELLNSFIASSLFEPLQRHFDRKKELEHQLSELAAMQGRGQKYIWWRGDE